MTNSPLTPGIVPGRLPADALARNFSDLKEPLSDHEALVAADRCYFCHDAPCITACPTEIDIPLFIRQIQTGTPEAAGVTIFDQNILGGMCARVCPVEQLCEEACVREAAEGKPVEIGRLQRYATDSWMLKDDHPYARADSTGKRIAVVGAGPAGLACAHRLAMKGHEAVIFDANDKPGGLNEYGIASYKTVDGFAEAEVEWLLKIGGITVRTGQRLGRDVTLDQLRDEYDAVFLGVGLDDVQALEVPGEDKENVVDAITWIEKLRQATDMGSLPVGRHVVVIGGGMTAVDAAVQAKLLGAREVTMVYRRGRRQMSASPYEQTLAGSKGVNLILNAQPVAIHGNGAVAEVEFEYTEERDGLPQGTGEKFRLPADQVMKAIGQRLAAMPEGLEVARGKIVVDNAGRSSLPGVWAGGDCIAGGEDLTVTSVAQGRDAAEDIHRALMG